MTSRLPGLVIIGAPKAGTTTLSHWLRLHPQVAFSAEKELSFFDDNYDRGLDWYGAQFPRDAGDRLLAEATPTYLGHPDVPGRVAQSLPETRFAAILREPVSRAWSNYWFFCQLGVERRSWRRALEAERRGEPGPGYLALGRYAEQLARWDAAVGPNRLAIFLIDDLRTDPETVYGDLCRFAGIDALVPPGEGPVNPTSRPRSRTLQAALRSGNSGRLRRAAYHWNAHGGPVPKIDAAERAQLVSEFAGDNARLAQRLGRPLPPSWS